MKKNNFNLLLKIIDIHLKKLKEKPSKNDIILHLRIGDAILNYDNKTDKFTYKINYATKFENIKKNLHIFKNKNVIIFYGNHQNNINLKPTEIYLDKIRDLFRKNNIIFKEHNSGNPDEDFLYMTNSYYFVKSGGGYSNLISKIVKHKNNVVYDIS